jgi:hypothetical protein
MSVGRRSGRLSLRTFGGSGRSTEIVDDDLQLSLHKRASASLLFRFRQIDGDRAHARTVELKRDLLVRYFLGGRPGRIDPGANVIKLFTAVSCDFSL